MSDKAQCIKCRWSAMLEHRYDQVHCTNGESPEAWGDVEATGSCELFQIKDQNKNMSDTPRTDDEVMNGSDCYAFARQLERELNAAKAEVADNLALIKRLHRAISARMCADEPTGEERLELMHAWTAAQETIDKAKL